MRTRIIMGAVIAALLLLIVIAGPAACNRMRAMQQQSKIDRGQGEASINAGVEAIGTIANQSQRDVETEKEVRNAIDQINAAPAGDSNDAALRAVCGLRTYRATRQCAELRAADTSADEGANTAR